MKAGICRHVEDYRWSSYADYISEVDGLVGTADVLAMFSQEPKNQVKAFKEFMEVESDAGFADIDDSARPTDEKLQERMFRLCGVRSASEFQRLAPGERRRSIQLLRNGGMSIRQIVRLTGVPFGIVRSAGRP